MNVINDKIMIMIWNNNNVINDNVNNDKIIIIIIKY